MYRTWFSWFLLIPLTGPIGMLGTPTVATTDRQSSPANTPPLVYEEPRGHHTPPTQSALPVPTAASLSPDETLILHLLSLSPPDDHNQHQDLLCHMAEAFNLLFELLDILQPAGPLQMALPIHSALLQPAQAV